MPATYFFAGRDGDDDLECFLSVDDLTKEEIDLLLGRLQYEHPGVRFAAGDEAGLDEETTFGVRADWAAAEHELQEFSQWLSSDDFDPAILPVMRSAFCPQAWVLPYRATAARLVGVIRGQRKQRQEEGLPTNGRDRELPKKRSRIKRKRQEPRALTIKQNEAFAAVYDCGGNIAEAARRLGKDPATVRQHYLAALKKLGQTSLTLKQRPCTQSLPHDRRGQGTIASEDDCRF